MSECYGMADDFTYYGGLPVTDPQKRLQEDALRRTLIDEHKELASMAGFKLTRIRVPDDGGPIRYDIAFLPEVPSFKARTDLETKNWDVGQEMGDKQLSFYVTKRSQKGQGWEV